MIEDLRMERRIMQQMLGTAARLVEHGPTACEGGRVEIHLGAGLLGSGSGFAAALADAMTCVVPGRESDMPTAI